MIHNYVFTHRCVKTQLYISTGKIKFSPFNSHDSTKACCDDSGLHPNPLSLQAIHVSQNLRQQWLQEASPHHTETAHAPHMYIYIYIRIVHSNHNTCIDMHVIDIHTARISVTHCFLFAPAWTQKNLHSQELPRGSKRSMASLSTRTRCVSRRLRSKARCTCGWPGCNEQWLNCRT